MFGNLISLPENMSMQDMMTKMMELAQIAGALSGPLGDAFNAAQDAMKSGDMMAMMPAMKNLVAQADQTENLPEELKNMLAMVKNIPGMS